MNIDRFKLGLFSNERVLKENAELSSDDLFMVEKRLEYWKNFVGSGYAPLEKYLTDSAVSIDKIKLLLSEKHFQIKENEQTICWSEIIDEFEKGLYEDINLPMFKWFNSDKNSLEDNPPFINFMEPFLKIALGKLRKDLENKYNKSSSITINESLEKQFLQILIGQLYKDCIRVLILELNVCREEGQLLGDTPEDKLNYYCNVLLKDINYINAILEEYPVMFRMISTNITNWTKNICNVLDRICIDKTDIINVFSNGKDIGNLATIQGGLSDSHNGGQGVFHLTFESGLNIMYKPRSLALDEKFNDFIGWYNNLVYENQLYQLKLIDKIKYGWMEYIDNKPCKNERELENYYLRMGSVLCILYIFRATDFHYENIIAHGDQPILIDIEALFHNTYTQNENLSANDKISNIIESSVKRVGILPSLLWSKNGIKGVDISGLGGEENQTIPIEMPVIKNLFTDKIKITYDVGKLKTSKNRPIFNNNKIDINSYKDTIIKGFEKVYSLFAKAETKEKLLEKIRNFDEVNVRQIIRNTQRYSTLLNIGTHPDFLRSGLDREMLFSTLWKEVNYLPKLQNVISSELSDLLFNDIPYFSSRPNQLNLQHSNGSVIERFFDKSSMDLTENLVNNLSDEDYEIQKKIINMSFVSSLEQKEKIKHISIKKMTNGEKLVLQKKCLDSAIQIGDYLINSAFYGDSKEKEDIGWIITSVTGVSETDWSIEPAGVDLYNGISGIAVFFAYLYKITGQKKYLHITNKCLVSIKETLEKIFSLDHNYAEYSTIGSFSGESSVIYALQLISSIIDDKSLINLCFTIAQRLKKQIHNDKNYDIISGSAGCIIQMLNLYNIHGDDEFLNIAIMCAEHLINEAKVIDNGLAWKPIIASNALAGYSHGASGIATALMSLGNKINNDEYIKAAYKALNFERQLFVEKEGNWADKRAFNGVTNDELNIIPVAWCHGAPGILLSRLQMLNFSHPNEEAIKIYSDIEIALDTTMRKGFGRSHSLCHGDIGNLQILDYAYTTLGRGSIDDFNNSYMSSIINELMNNNWQCGLPNQNETPGLMIGLAGIGLGLLKMYEPSVPSVLRLEIPR